MNSPSVERDNSSVEAREREIMATSGSKIILNQSSDLGFKDEPRQDSTLPNIADRGHSQRTFDFQTKSNQVLLANQRSSKSPTKGTIIVKGETYLQDTPSKQDSSREIVRGHVPSRSVALHPSEIQLHTSRSRITDGSNNSFARDDTSARRKDPSMQIPVNALVQNERRRQRNDWLDVWA